MSTPVHYSTFDAFRPHFDALQRVGYFKMVMKKLTRRRYVIHNCYMTMAFVFIMLYNLQHFVQVVQNLDSTDVIVDTLFVLLTTLNTLGKQLAFNLRSARIDRLIGIIDGPLFASSHVYHDDVMRANARDMSRLLRLYHAAIFTCGTLWAIFPFVNRALQGKVQFVAYFPFETDRSPAFELAIIYLSVLITFQAYGNVTMDCTIVSFYAQSKTQLQILRFNLENLLGPEDGAVNIDANVNNSNNRRAFKDIGRGDYQTGLQRRFVHCVHHYRFSAEVESIFGEAMVVQFFVMAWVICMTLYKIVALNLISAEFVSMAVYLGCMLAQLFIYCYYGTQLKMESELVNQSVYFCDWVRLSPKFRKQLLVLMERCVHPIRPRAAYVIPMSLETYIAVLRSSYTLFTILDRK